MFYWRRRLPGARRGAEVAVSLGTRQFREAEHLAALADEAFGEECVTEKEGAAWDALRAIADPTPRGVTVEEPAAGAAAAAAVRSDLAPILALRRAVRDVVRKERAGGPFSVRIPAGLLKALGVPGPAEPAATETAREEAIAPAARETVTTSEKTASPAARETVSTTAATKAAPPREAAPAPAEPLASAVLETFAGRREKDGRPLRMVDQACGTARRFIAWAGDKPLRAYERGDIVGFSDEVLRRLPPHYSRSSKRRARPLADIIREADEQEKRDGVPVPRLSEVAVQRQHSELSAFFLFGVNHRPQLLRFADHAELFKRHRFAAAEGARDQREPWPDADLKALFDSPVFRRCGPRHHTRPGPHIVRDWRFWLPLMELFQGARLEELADLYRHDIKDDGDTPYLDIRAHRERKDGHKRRLKTTPSERKVPVHPEVLRMGFLAYVERVAPNPGDPLFPELSPQGRDGRRGPRFTRWFGYYRRGIGLYREGMAGHALRHNANTGLRNAITNEQQRRHVNYMFGWGGGGAGKDNGGEGERRYDQGPPPRESVATLALLRYPELDFSHLYVA